VRAFYEATEMPLINIERLNALQPIAMQLDIREGLGGSLIIADSTNIDINSLAIALDYMKNIAGGRRRMLILSDILYSSVPDAELYAKVAAMVSAAGLDCIVGIGERIKAHGAMFGGSNEFYATAEEFLKKLSQDEIAGMAVLVKGNRSADFQKIVHQLQRKSHTTVLEVDLDAMAANLAYFRSMVGPQVKLMAMVKASGYGNGNYEVANMLYNNGVD
jgi:alanine racemase